MFVHVVCVNTKERCSMYSSLSLFSAGELMAGATPALAVVVAQSVVAAPVCDYWVVEKQRLVSMGKMDWSLMAARLKVRT